MKNDGKKEREKKAFLREVSAAQCVRKKAGAVRSYTMIERWGNATAGWDINKTVSTRPGEMRCDHKYMWGEGASGEYREIENWLFRHLK